MRKRLAVVAGLLGLLLLLGWWAMPVDPVAVEPLSPTSRVRRTLQQADPDPDPRKAMVDGLAAALEICARCARGEAEGTVCAACTGDLPVPEPAAEPEPEPSTVELVVDVVNEDGRPEDRARVSVGGCPVLGNDGNTYRVAVGLECTVQAYRREGALWIPSPVERVRIGPDGAYVQVELPEARVGGLGIGFRTHPDGVMVDRVMPGTPAAAMGLQHGDLITEVDGLPTRGLDQQDFVRTMTGPVGSEVEFTLRYRDENGVREERKTLRRAFLEGS